MKHSLEAFAEGEKKAVLMTYKINALQEPIKLAVMKLIIGNLEEVTKKRPQPKLWFNLFY